MWYVSRFGGRAIVPGLLISYRKLEPIELPVWEFQHIQEIKKELDWVEMDILTGA